MPTYEYQCRECGERLEVFQSFSAKPLKTHDACGGQLAKVFHPSGVVFKGSGYYVTDSRSKASSSSSSTTDSQASEKADSKAGEKAGAGASKAEPARASKSDSKAPTEAAAS